MPSGRDPGLQSRKDKTSSAAPRVPAVWPVRSAHPEGPHRQPRRGSLELPAGLQGRIALRQDLEAALEEPHVPVPQEIQPLSLSARQPLILRGRHAAPEATLTATRKQLAGGAKSTLSRLPTRRLPGTEAMAIAAYCPLPKSSSP